MAVFELVGNHHTLLVFQLRGTSHRIAIDCRFLLYRINDFLSTIVVNRQVGKFMLICICIKRNTIDYLSTSQQLNRHRLTQSVTIVIIIPDFVNLQLRQIRCVFVSQDNRGVSVIVHIGGRAIFNIMVDPRFMNRIRDFVSVCVKLRQICIAIFPFTITVSCNFLSTSVKEHAIRMQVNRNLFRRILVSCFTIRSCIIPLLFTGNIHYIVGVGKDVDNVRNQILVEGCSIDRIHHNRRFFHRPLSHDKSIIIRVVNHQRQFCERNRPGIVTIICHSDQDICIIHLICVVLTLNRSEVSGQSNIACTADIVLQRQQVQEFFNVRTDCRGIIHPLFCNREVLILNGIGDGEAVISCTVHHSRIADSSLDVIRDIACFFNTPCNRSVC